MVPLEGTRTDLTLPTLAAIETAIAFWGLLLPAGQRGQALRHMDMITDSSTGDVSYLVSKEPGWKPEYNALWFEYLNEKGGKGISKDTWHMVSDLSNQLFASRYYPLTQSTDDFPF